VGGGVRGALRFEGHHGRLDVEALVEHLCQLGHVLAMQRRRVELVVLVSPAGWHDAQEWMRDHPFFVQPDLLPPGAVVVRGPSEMARAEVRVLVNADVLDTTAPLSCPTCRAADLRRMAAGA
jgi:hypothetical protein